MSEHDASTREQLIQRIRELSSPLTPQATAYAPDLRPLDGVRAVVFDIYGTLFVSGSGDVGTATEHEDDTVLREVLAHVGLLAPGVGELPGGLLEQAIREDHAAMRARGIEFPEVDIVAVWAVVLERLGAAVCQEAVDEARLRLLAVEYECRTNPVWPMPGLDPLLAELSGRGMPLGIVSNAQFYTPLLFPALAQGELEALGFRPELCAFSYRLREAKPSTRLFAGVLDRLQAHHGISPREALYVGNDRLKDIWPAARLGLRTTLFAGDRRSLRLRADDPRCADTRPDTAITELGQLPALVPGSPA